MEILPLDSVFEFTSIFTDVIQVNMLVIIGVVALAVGIVFVVRWFWNSVEIFKSDSGMGQTARNRFKYGKSNW